MRQELFANEISQLVSNMGYDVSADTILSRTAGVIANANTELLFAGVSLRSFEFNWLIESKRYTSWLTGKNDNSCFETMVCS